MKVLHVNCSEKGSTGKIIADISRVLHREGHSSVLCTPKSVEGDTETLKKYVVALPREQGVYRRLASVFGLRYGLAPLATYRILRIIRREKPDIVHLHSANCFTANIYKLLGFLKREAISTVVTNHAEFFYTGNCSYAIDCDRWRVGCGECPRPREASGSLFFDRTHTAWRLMKRAFSDFPRLEIVSVSPWVGDRARLSPIMAGLSHHVIENGVNNAIFRRTAVPTRCDGVKTVLHVTSSFTRDPDSMKGSPYLIELARRFLGEPIRFLVAGPASVGEADLPENLTLLGSISDQYELARLYSEADLTVLTSRRETFGMAVAESLCCGTPVLGFRSGGSESIALPGASAFLPFGDVDGMERVMRERWLSEKTDERAEEIAREAAHAYSGERMGERYLSLYRSMTAESGEA